MVKKTKLAVLVSTLLWGAAVGTASAAIAAADQTVARESAALPSIVGPSGYVTPALYSAPPEANLLAKHGADDPLPEPCDDHGTDLCHISAPTVAKHGADDPLPPQCDDHGTDLCHISAPAVAKHGADDPLPEPCDDHGTDICKSEA